MQDDLRYNNKMKNDNVINVYVHLANREEIHGIVDKLSAIINLGERIMSAISDFVAKQNEHNDKMESSLGALKEDINGLKEMINKMQNSPGNITEEDQKALNDLEARTEALADKLSALDDLTPPVAPTDVVPTE